MKFPVAIYTSSIDNGGSGPLVVFWTIFWYILAQQGENLAWEPFLLFRGLRAPLLFFGGLGGFWTTCCLLVHFGGLDQQMVHFGATGGTFGLGAPFLLFESS